MFGFARRGSGADNRSLESFRAQPVLCALHIPPGYMFVPNLQIWQICRADHSTIGVAAANLRCLEERWPKVPFLSGLHLARAVQQGRPCRGSFRYDLVELPDLRAEAALICTRAGIQVCALMPGRSEGERIPDNRCGKLQGHLLS